MNIYSIDVNRGVTLYKFKTTCPAGVMEQICGRVLFCQYSENDACLSLALTSTDVVFAQKPDEIFENLCAVTLSGTGFEEKLNSQEIINALDCTGSLYGISMSEVEFTLLLPGMYAKDAGMLIINKLGIDI